MNHTVLLVDDDQNILDGLRRSLRKENYKTLCATSADQALELIRSQPVDVVVSDQDMPGTKGTELLAMVHNEFPDTIRFMLTGQATLEVAIQAINQGAISRFFTKPCNLTDLAVTIQQALQNKVLLAQANRMLKKIQAQSEIIHQMEKESPGITKVKRDAGGAIIVETEHTDFEVLMKEIDKTFSED